MKEIEAVLAITGVSAEDLTSRSRKQDIVFARMILSKLLREKGMTLYQIAAEIHRDHSTISYYLKIYDDELKFNCEFWELDTMARKELKQNSNEHEEK